MKEDIRSHTIEDEEWKYENNLPKRPIPWMRFWDDDDSEENSGDVDSEDRASENERSRERIV